MNKKCAVFLYGFFLMVIVISGFAVFYSRQEKKSELPKVSDASPFSSSVPTVFVNTGEGTRGVSTPLDSEWNLYTNKALGFKLVYPTKRFPYGIIRTGEIKDYKPVQAQYAGDPFYQIVFSDGDFSPIYVIVEPSRSSDINTWLATQRDYQPLSSYGIRHRVVDGRNTITIRHIPMDEIENSKEEDIREHLMLIRDGVLYDVDVSHLNTADREMIFESFRLF